MFLLTIYVLGSKRKHLVRCRTEHQVDCLIRSIRDHGFDELDEKGEKRIFWPAHRIDRIELQLAEDVSSGAGK